MYYFTSGTEPSHSVFVSIYKEWENWENAQEMEFENKQYEDVFVTVYE